MNFYLFIPFLLILIFFLPVRMEGRISFNVLDQSGAFGIYIYGIKVQYQLFWIENKKIITKKENSLVSHELNTNSKGFLYNKILIFEIKDKTKLKEFFVFYNFGVKDAFQTAMLGGAINSALIILMTRIKNVKPTASLGVYDTFSYNREVCQFATRALLTISLFDVVYSLLRSVILTKKQIGSMELKNGGRK